MKGVLAVALGIVSLTWVVLAQERSSDQNSGTNPHHAASESKHGTMHPGPTMKIEFENDSVQVMTVLVGPHERIPMHDIVSPRVQILLTDEHLKITFSNGDTREKATRPARLRGLNPRGMRVKT